MKRRGRPPQEPDKDQLDAFDQPAEEPVRGEQGRDRALALLEEHRPYVVARLREAAYAAWEATQEPVSVNDVRHILAEEHYEGDPRILGCAFPWQEWARIGEDRTNSRLANARPIGLFIPRERRAQRIAK